MSSVLCSLGFTFPFYHMLVMILSSSNHMALNSLYCADLLLRNYSVSTT